MKKVINFMFGFIAATFIASCGTSKINVADESLYGVSAKNAVNVGKIDTFNTRQLDSMIMVDKLPVYSKWNKTAYKDAENSAKCEYGVLVDNAAGIIYTVKFENNTYIV